VIEDSDIASSDSRSFGFNVEDPLTVVGKLAATKEPAVRVGNRLAKGALTFLVANVEGFAYKTSRCRFYFAIAKFVFRLA